MLILYYKFSMDWKTMWLTLILIMKINMGSRKSLGAMIVIGLFSKFLILQMKSNCKWSLKWANVWLDHQP